MWGARGDTWGTRGDTWGARGDTWGTRADTWGAVTDPGEFLATRDKFVAHAGSPWRHVRSWRCWKTCQQPVRTELCFANGALCKPRRNRRSRLTFNSDKIVYLCRCDRSGQHRNVVVIVVGVAEPQMIFCRDLVLAVCFAC